jgi:septal ring-binding cell division protein DamX
VELWREQFTGAIRFENDGIIKIIYFKGGDILSASTNDRSDSIDEILMRAGKVSREHVKQALAKRKESETLGDALLNLGFITRKELTWARRVQVVGVIRSIAAWAEGSFTIVADYLPKRDEGTLFPLPQVLVELIVTEQDRGRFEKALDGGNAVFAKNADFDDVWRRLGLNEDAEAIIREIDGEKSAGEVATVSGRDTFNVYKLLHALATLRILRRIEKAQVQPQFALDDFASAGVADAADMWAEPAAAPPAQFELDEDQAASQPTLGIPLVAIPEEAPAYPIADEPRASFPATSAWDDETEEVPLPVAPLPVTTETQFPAWDAPPREALAVPIPAAIEPPVEPAEPHYGFDEAQIETARRASVPVTRSEPISAMKGGNVPVKEPKGRSGLWIALPVVLLLAGAGYFGWQWWLTQQQEQAAVVVQRPRRTVPAPAVPAASDTATATATDTAATTDTGTIVETTTTAPAPAPAVVTPVTPVATTAKPPVTATTATAAPGPAPAPLQITALPKVTPVAPSTTRPAAGAGRERYDAMARDFAANASGNFTVQIQILCDTGNLDKAMRSGGSNVWFVPQTIGSRSCYRVFWGRYATREEAQQALAQVPAGLRDRNSAVKAVPKG